MSSRLTGGFLGPQDSRYHDAKTMPKLRLPEHVQDARVTPYLRIPYLPEVNDLRYPSIVPPDNPMLVSKLEKQTRKKPSPNVSLQEDGNGNPLLYIHAPYREVWNNLAIALKKAGYPMNKKEPKAHAYFLLDNKQSKTEQSTIYLLYLKPGINYTQLSVYNARKRPVEVAVSKRLLSAIAKQFS